MFNSNKFWSNKLEVDRGYVSPCWLWQGATDKDGYGVTTKDSEYIRVHILSYKLMNTNYSKAFLICHKCNVKGCFRPSHLYKGDQRTNALDSVKAGTHVRARLTHCKYGHPFNETNTRYHTSKKGKFQRICITCEQRRNITR